MKNYVIIWILMLTLAAIFYLSTPLYAQPKVIKVGERCPDVVLSMFNYETSIAKLSDFKEPLVILDFWTTYCGSCIHGILKYHKLQQSYQDKIRFIPVTHESRIRVKNFWTNNPNTKKLKIPSIVEDTILKTYFPHETIGMQVWLSSDKTVLAITDAEYVTAENIDNLLHDAKISLPERYDVAYNFNTSLFKVDDVFSDHNAYTFHSGLMGYLRGNLGTFGLKYDTIGQTVRAYGINLSILDLYREALEGTDYVPNLNRFVLEAKDLSRYFLRLKKEFYNREWKDRYTFCYEQTAPLGTSKEDVLRNMIADLNRYLNLRGRVEQRFQKCWIVKDLPNKQEILSDKGIQYNFAGLLTALNLLQRKQRIVLNESNIKDVTAIPENIYTAIVNRDGIELEELNTLLAKINLHAVEEQRQIEVFVLSEGK